VSRAALLTFRSFAVVAARLGLGGLFLYAGIIKGLDVRRFADDIANYHALPASLVPLAAATLPGIEVAVGLALIVGRYTRGAALVVSGLMLVFLGALLSAFARGIDLSCGCFGGDATPADGTTVLRDVVLLAGGLLVARWFDGRWSLDRRAGEPQESRSTSQ